MASVSQKMGLRVWDQLADPYDHSQLAANWYKVDLHDHTPGRGVQIPAEGIADGAITGTKIGSSAVTSSNIVNGTLHPNDFGTLPHVRVTRTTAQSIPASSSTAISFDSELYDNYPIGLSEQHSTSTNPTRLTCVLSGLYEMGGAVQFVASAAGTYRNAYIQLNGLTVLAYQTVANTSTIAIPLAVSTTYRLTAGDYIELFATQDGGGSLNTTNTSDSHIPHELWFSWIGP